MAFKYKIVKRPRIENTKKLKNKNFFNIDDVFFCFIN